MNNTKKIDSIIKDALPKDIVCIPDDIDQMINSTLEDLPKRKKKNSIFNLAKVSSIILAITICMGTLSYAATGEIPLIKDFLTIFEKSYDVNSEFKKYLSVTDPYEVKDKGVTISLLGAMASDMGFTIVEKIEYDKSVEKKIPNEVAGAIYINGEYKGFNGSSIQTEKVNDTTFLRIQDIDSKNFDSPPNFPDKFNFEYVIKGLSGVDGTWSLKGNIDNSKLKENTITKNLNRKIATDETELIVDKFLINPLSARIYYREKDTPKFSWSNQQDIHILKSFILIDDKNKSYLPILGSGTLDEDNFMDCSIEFFKNGEIPKTVTLIPMIEQYKTDPKINEYVEKPLKPQKLNFGELGTLEIKKVVREDTNIKLVAKKSGIVPLNYLSIVGSKDNSSLICCNLKQLYAENKDEFTMIFNYTSGDKINKLKDYSLKYPIPYKLNLYKDKAITIDLSN